MPNSNAVKTVQNVLKLLCEGGGFNRIANNANVIAAEPGRCKVELTVVPEITNPFGTLHGGFTAAMADIVTTVALINTKRGEPGVSVDLNVSYLSAAKLGETVHMEGYVLKAGKRLAFTGFDVRRAKDNTLIAQARHTKAFTA